MIWLIVSVVAVWIAVTVLDKNFTSLRSRIEDLEGRIEDLQPTLELSEDGY